jgi:hypothetical protein
MVRSGRLQDLLAGGSQVEIVADRVPDELAQTALRGVAMEPVAQGVRLLVEAARKREAVESLWAAGCDVIAMNPLRSTLEELFLKEVDR